MSLTSGSRIGHYEVSALIGAGGMGEVYRARDTKLNRDVALKVLPAAFARDAERMARFQREAQILASLNHAGIAGIYGLEENALAMELVEGPTLAERIARGPLPVDEALPMARQIAEALEYAHERGIIHRDLKPANVKISGEGKVKILDFGLAKALEPAGTGDSGSAAGLARSPTITAMATQAGVILGTAGYMSPEQARGKSVDRRADIWAFGCLLWEMLTGRQLFSGETISDALAAVLTREPDWPALPEPLPPPVERILRRCLERDPTRRLQSIGEARIAVEDALSLPPGPHAMDRVPKEAGVPLSAPVGRRALPWLAAGLLGAALGALGWRALADRESAPPRPPVRFSITLQPEEQFNATEDTNCVVSFSQDGRSLVYSARRKGIAQLFLRRMGTLEPTPLPGTEGGRNAFFSPDGKWVVFIAGGKLQKVSLDGGSPQVICDSDWGAGDWTSDGSIIFTRSYAQGLWKVPFSGGTPVKLTEPNRSEKELGHWWPQILPGGNDVLFTAWITPVEKARLVVLSLETGRKKVVLEGGSFARYLPTGHLLYMRSEGLMAVPFDLKGFEVTGAPVRITDDLRVDQQDGNAHFSMSRDGAMVYLPKHTLESPNDLVWVDRQGTVEPISLPPAHREHPRLSPDGRRIAFTSYEQDRQDLWVYDIDRGTSTRVAAGPTSEFSPTWTIDGKHLIYNLEQSQFDIAMSSADGAGTPRVLRSSSFDKLAASLSPDGRRLAYTENHPETGMDIWAMTLEGAGELEAKPYLQTQSDEQSAAFSPDGRWLAYQSDASGRIEVYVQGFPGPGERVQVSVDGGGHPVWSRNGRELYFRTGEFVMAAAVTGGKQFSVGKPVGLFKGTYDFAFAGPNYDVSPDGRFLMVRTRPDAAPRTMVVVLNWLEELRSLLPGPRPAGRGNAVR